MARVRPLISVGWNDVPKFGGGLYGEDDQSVWDDRSQSIHDNDHRCFKWKSKICHNETRRLDILDKLVTKIQNSEILKEGVEFSIIKKVLKGTEVDYIIEYSRSIHAEMEAILAAAREGKYSLVGATLYTTTYPCHNCARHIVASGIKSVIYIQPYAKSLAIALHGDAVTEIPGDPSKVVFRQYEGVAPRNVLKFFQTKADRKREGKLFRPQPKNAPPLLQIQLDASVEYESKVIADLSVKEVAAPRDPRRLRIQ